MLWLSVRAPDCCNIPGSNPLFTGLGLTAIFRWAISRDGILPLAVLWGYKRERKKVKNINTTKKLNK
jgi:hypothetical protein